MKKYITFTLLIEKEVMRTGEEIGEELQKNVSYIIQFIDSARFLYQILLIIYLKDLIELNVK